MKLGKGIGAALLVVAMLAVTLLFSAQIALAGAASKSRADVVEYAPGLPVVGSSKLVRNENGIAFTLNTSGLEPGHAYTVWWFMVSDTDACFGGPNPQGPCDFFLLTNAGGGLAGGTGKANFAGHISTGEIPEDAVGSFGGDFDDPYGVDIFLIVRTHGPKIPGMQHEQTTTLNGGCNAGEPNEGLCTDVQESDHCPSGSVLCF